MVTIKFFTKMLLILFCGSLYSVGSELPAIFGGSVVAAAGYLLCRTPNNKLCNEVKTFYDTNQEQISKYESVAYGAFKNPYQWASCLGKINKLAARVADRKDSIDRRSRYIWNDKCTSLFQENLRLMNKMAQDITRIKDCGQLQSGAQYKNLYAVYQSLPDKSLNYSSDADLEALARKIMAGTTAWPLHGAKNLLEKVNTMVEKNPQLEASTGKEFFEWTRLAEAEIKRSKGLIKELREELLNDIEQQKARALKDAAKAAQDQAVAAKQHAQAAQNQADAANRQAFVQACAVASYVMKE